MTFDDFTLSKKTGLLRHGRPVELRTKSLDVLLALVARRGEIVAREELFATVWGTRNHAASAVIEQSITDIRRALGDNKRSPYRYIETVVNQGYRFSAAVTSEFNVTGTDLEECNRLAQPLRQFLPVGPHYPVPIRHHSSFEGVLLREAGRELKGFSRLVMETPALIVHGSGGSGKTIALVSLAIELAGLGVLPAYVDLSLLPHFLPQKGSLAEMSLESLLDLLLLCSPAPLPRSDISRRFAVLLIDGFNELSDFADLHARLFACLQPLRLANPSLHIVVADRFNARPEADRYGYVRISLEPLPIEFVRTLDPSLRSVSPRTLEILRIPLFLDLWLRRADQREYLSKADMLRDALITRLRLDEQMPSLALEAYLAYVEGRRHFVPNVPEQWDRLLTAGYLRRPSEATDTTNNYVSFSHELFHDWLAAAHVSSRQVPWNQDTFNSLSLEAQNFEGIQLALEQLAVAERQDFLIQVYDWSYIACVACMAEEERFAVVDGLSQEVRSAMLASIAEIQYDMFPHSRRTAERTLRRLPRSLRYGFLVGEPHNSERDLRTHVGAIPVSRLVWFEQWKALFSRRSGTIEPYMLSALVDDNVFVGWAASNMLRRLSGPEIIGQLEGSYISFEKRKPYRSHRWRIVHAAGTSRDPAAVTFLARAVQNDEHQWVRYGALRSLVEVGLRRPGLRNMVFEELHSLAASLLPICRFELSRVLNVDRPSANWTRAATALADTMRRTFPKDPRVNWAEVKKTLLRRLAERPVVP